MFDFHFTCSEKEPKKEPDSDSAKIQIEYVKLWMEQSKLFWSRLQTATALHTGVLIGWFYLIKEEDWEWLSPFLLWTGVALSIFLMLAMIRDFQYMKAMQKLSGESFPQPKQPLLGGFWCLVLAMSLLTAIELLFYFRYV